MMARWRLANGWLVCLSAADYGKFEIVVASIVILPLVVQFDYQ